MHKNFNLSEKTYPKYFVTHEAIETPQNKKKITISPTKQIHTNGVVNEYMFFLISLFLCSFANIIKQFQSHKKDKLKQINNESLCARILQ